MYQQFWYNNSERVEYSRISCDLGSSCAVLRQLVHNWRFLHVTTEGNEMPWDRKKTAQLIAKHWADKLRSTDGWLQLEDRERQVRCMELRKANGISKNLAAKFETALATIINTRLSGDNVESGTNIGFKARVVQEIDHGSDYVSHIVRIPIDTSGKVAAGPDQIIVEAAERAGIKIGEDLEYLFPSLFTTTLDEGYLSIWGDHLKKRVIPEPKS